jgi:hypothetical protein
VSWVNFSDSLIRYLNLGWYGVGYLERGLSDEGNMFEVLLVGVISV